MVTGTSRVCRVNKDPQWLKEEDYGKFPGFCRTGIGIRFFFSPGLSLELSLRLTELKDLLGLKSTEIWGRGYYLHAQQIKPQLSIIISIHNVKLEALNNVNG